MTTRSPLFVGLAALVLAACMPALGRAPARAPAPAAALSCALEVSGDRSRTYRAVVTADRGLSGTYALRLRGGGAVIDQGGPFAATAGQRLTLGEASLTGPVARDTALTLTVDGRDYRCPVVPR